MNINLKQLKRRCNMKISEYWDLGKTVKTKDGSYTYIDRGMPVLAVAHLDTVNNSLHFEHVTLDKKHVVFSTALDDRLGAYIILDYLPKVIGNNFDVLLTEGEEIGRSTAQWFEPSHDYNWMYQFDRAGDDVVLYQYDSNTNRELLRKHKFVPSWGSFSDICYLDHLECTGFNFGCGYEDNHSMYSHMEVETTELMIRQFIPFFNEYKDFYLPVPSKKEKLQRWSGSIKTTGFGSNSTPTDTYEWKQDKNGRWYKDGGDWKIGEDGIWRKDSTTSGASITKYSPKNDYIKRSYEVGDCVNCNKYNVDVDEEGLCAICAKEYQEALSGAGLTYDLCNICSNYELVDSSGTCAECAGWLTGGKK